MSSTPLADTRLASTPKAMGSARVPQSPFLAAGAVAPLEGVGPPTRNRKEPPRAAQSSPRHPALSVARQRNSPNRTRRRLAEPGSVAEAVAAKPSQQTAASTASITQPHTAPGLKDSQSFTSPELRSKASAARRAWEETDDAKLLLRFNLLQREIGRRTSTHIVTDATAPGAT